MANALARLVVLLGLDKAEYTRGLTKAEAEAQQFASNITRDITKIAGFIGGLELGRVFLDAAKDIVTTAAALSDLSDATGSSVESLSKLANQAAIAGTDFAKVESALLKLASGMSGADKNSEQVRKTLQMLGITTRDPAEALQQFAVKLNTYADGINKTGLAVAVLDSEGRALLPTLKTMAENQDVAATTTEKMARDAAELTTQINRLSSESKTFATIVLRDVVPTLTDMIREIRISTEVAGGLLSAFTLFSGLDLRNPQKKIEELTQSIADLEKQKTTGGLFSDVNNRLVQKHIDDTKKQLEFVKAMERIRHPIDFGPPVIRPDAPPPPPRAGGGGAGSGRERQSEAEQYLKSLKQQTEAAQELSATEQVLREIQDGRLKDASHGQKEKAMAYAQEIEAARALKDAKKEEAKAQADAARERERIADTAARTLQNAERERDALQDATERERERLIATRDGEAALNDYVNAKQLKIAAEKEDLAAMGLALGMSKEWAQAQRDAAQAIRERVAIGKQITIAEDMKKEMEELKKVQEQVFDIGANALTDFITGTKSAKDAFKSFVQDLNRFLINQAFGAIKNQMFGGGAAGTGIFDLIAKMFATGGGGASTVGASSAPFAFTPGLEGFASGGVSRGGLALVGEQGPELVNLPAGARVMSSGQTREQLGPQLTVVQNIMPGADTRAHRQAALDAFTVAAGAARRR